MENKNNKPWLINCRVKRGYWVNEDNRKKALKWLIEDKLDIFNNDYKLTSQDFTDNGLGVLYNNYFYKSIKLVFKFLYPENYMDIYKENENRFKKYPDDYKPWINSRAPKNYWKDENNRRRALKWLIEEKLDIFNTDNKLTKEDFINNRLDVMMRHYYGSIEKVFKFLYPENYMDICEDNKNRFKKYPDDYKPWIDGKVPYGYWTNENNRKKALKWLIEDKLDIFNTTHKLVLRDFEDNGLDRLLIEYFGSIKSALKFIYPENYMDIYEDNKNK